MNTASACDRDSVFCVKWLLRTNVAGQIRYTKSSRMGLKMSSRIPASSQTQP